LKLAAIRELEYEAFLGFLGVRDSEDRLATYRQIEQRLSHDARAFFEDSPRLIRNGILLQGNLERYLALISRVLGFARPGKLATLFQFDDLDQQRRFLEGQWESRWWRLFKHTIARRSVVRLFCDDPGFHRFLPGDAVHRRVFDSIERYLWNNLARENHLLSLVFFGRYAHAAAMPLYLRSPMFQEIKAALETTSITIASAPMSEVLESSPAAWFDAFAISDIASYLEPEAFELLFEEIVRTGKPGARICSRRCLIPHELPSTCSGMIERDPELETRLARHDCAMVHEFLVGEIRCTG